MKSLIIATVLIFSITGCGYANLDEGKAVSNDVWKRVGFEVAGYEGFQWGIWLGGCYGGAKVWYQLNKIPDNGI